MAKFFGYVGYAETSENTNGVYIEEFTEYPYYGDVTQDLRKLQTTEHLNDDIILQNILSIVADTYAFEHFHSIRYIRWGGACWTVGYVEVRRPRLILRFGSLYKGQVMTRPEIDDSEIITPIE